MPLHRTQRIAVVRQPSGTSMDIGPQDYFVLSRIEGRPTVGEVLDSAGLPSAQTQEILARLLAIGAVEEIAEDQASAGASPTGAPALAARATTSRPATGAADARARAARRRRRTLVEGFGASTVRRTPTVEAPLAPAARQPAKETREVPAASPERPPQSLPPVPPSDARVDASLGIEVTEQRKLLALVDRAHELTPFEILGIHPTHDHGAIRNAFRQASRRFHPDAYHGRELGQFGGWLAQLFSGAKDAVKTLGDEAFRAPLVQAYETERARATAAEEQRRARMDAAKAAAEEIRNKRANAAADERRRARTRDRASAQRARVLTELARRAGEHREEADQAERAGNLASAANLYRLSLRVDPNQPDVKEKWEAVRTRARKERAKEAFSRANSYLELGQTDDARPLLVEAALADPTVDHLAWAADLVRTVDASRARELAMEALNALSREAAAAGDAKNKPRSTLDLAEVHLMIGRAFLSAGQKKTAVVQAKLAQALTPQHPQVRALLNSAKVK